MLRPIGLFGGLWYSAIAYDWACNRPYSLLKRPYMFGFPQI